MDKVNLKLMYYEVVIYCGSMEEWLMIWDIGSFFMILQKNGNIGVNFVGISLCYFLVEL